MIKNHLIFPLLFSFFRGETHKPTAERHARTGRGIFACTAIHQHPRYLAATAELLPSRQSDCGNILLKDIQRLRSQGEARTLACLPLKGNCECIKASLTDLWHTAKRNSRIRGVDLN